VAFEKARSEADIMPTSQLHKILKNEFGRNWNSKFKDFDINPFAAASIGQVHKVVLLNNKTAALKIQYPGVAHSIDSDLNNLKKLFEYFKVFPKGLYINELVRNLGNELRMECDYVQEAEKQQKFKSEIEVK
jgi:aarF domain-containing kinase